MINIRSARASRGHFGLCSRFRFVREGRVRARSPALFGAAWIVCLAVLSSAGWAIPPGYEEGGPGWDDFILGFDPASHRVTPDPINRIGADPASGGASAMTAQLSLGLQDAASAMREEATQAGSGNFQLAVPVVRLAGRGLDLALDLTYNSSLWTKKGGVTRFDVSAGWPAPGWSLGFGKLYARHSTDPETRDFLSTLVEPDGTSHTAQWDGEGNGFLSCIGEGDTIVSWHTTDGSRIDYKYRLTAQGRASCAEAKYPNGTVVLFTGPAAAS
jgi:hypothetical protein